MNYERLQLSNKCNNNCVFCNTQNIKSRYEKSLPTIINELDELRGKGVKKVILPCNAELHKDFFDILNNLKHRNFFITLESNGRLFYYKQHCRKVAKIVDEIHIIRIGSNQEEHDNRTRAPGSYEQLQRGMQNLDKINANYKTKDLFLSNEPKEGILKKPTQIVIEVTGSCNFNCISCFNKASFAETNRQQREMSTIYVKDIIDSAVSFGLDRIRFSGGEPLLRDDIFELINYAWRKGLRVWLNTNATLVTENNISSLESYVENVLVPFNGHDQESDYNWTQSEDSFNKKIKGVKLLKKSNIKKVRAGTVGSKENIDNLEKIYEFIKNLDLDNWEIYRPVPLSQEDYQFYYKKLINKLVLLSLDYSKIIPIANAYPFCIGKKEFSEMFSLGAISDDGHARIIVDPRGFCKPSYFIEEDIGNPLHPEVCWESQFMKKLRNLELIPHECKKCELLYKCKGGSRYAAKILNGIYASEDPVNRELFKFMNYTKSNNEKGIPLPTVCNKTPLKRNYNHLQFGNKKLIYYLRHPQDTKELFPTFVILDFYNYEKRYLTTYLPVNTKKLENFSSKDLICKRNEPHHALTLNENKDFYAFMYQNANFFYKVNYKENTTHLITTKDVELNGIKRLGDTFFSNNEIIYFSGIIQQEDNWKVKLYRSDLNFKNIAQVGEYHYPVERAPHTTLYHKGLIMNVHMLRSEIIVYNIQKNRVETYKTTGSVTGHIERSGDYIYVSNHNFHWKDGEVNYRAPASIDKFLVQDGKLIHRGYFMDEGGFRFTAHKIFQYNGIEYIVTIGQPNRLYIIRAADMSLACYDTIGKDVFQKNEEPIDYMNREGKHVKDCIKPVELSGEYIILISSKYIIIYSFSEMRIIQSIPIKEDIKVTRDINLEDFKPNSSHTNLIY